MIGEKHCPFCQAGTLEDCGHLALAVEARDFVRRSVELCQGQQPWRTLCQRRREYLRHIGEWSPEREDFTWLESAFCSEFLKHLRWFGSIDYEWRTGPKVGQGGFWILLWSKDPQRLWWELREEIERQCLSEVRFGLRKAGAATPAAAHLQAPLFKPPLGPAPAEPPTTPG